MVYWYAYGYCFNLLNHVLCHLVEFYFFKNKKMNFGARLFVALFISGSLLLLSAVTMHKSILQVGEMGNMSGSIGLGVGMFLANMMWSLFLRRLVCKRWPVPFRVVSERYTR